MGFEVGVGCDGEGPDFVKLWERLRGWVSSSEQEKVGIDRRAFLRGMTVTSVGLLVPGVSVFGFPRTGLLPDGNGNIYPPEVQRKALEDFQLISVSWVKDPVYPRSVFESGSGEGLYNLFVV